MKERFHRYGLDNVDRPKAVYEYYVTGNGNFPFDMLRYDACWPVTSMDIAAAFDTKGSRSVFIRSYREPTIDRWSSFLWSVGTEKLK